MPPSRVFRALVLAGLVILAGCGGGQPTATTSTTTAELPGTTAPATTTSSAPLPSSTSGSPAATLVFQDPGDLLVVGDWGSGTLPQGAVAGAMSRYSETHEVAAILTTGDNFYSDNADFLIEPLGWALDQDIPFWIAWGNHDVESQRRIELVTETFDAPPRWTVYEWGPVDVIVLDSNQIDDEEQMEFLSSALANSTDPTIVVFHRPAYTCGKYQSSPEVVGTWVARFDEDVFLVLNGHDHNYQRFDHEGISYVVSGGGGRRLYDLGDCPDGHPARAAGASLYHFLALDLEETEVQVTAFDVNGSEIDGLSLQLP